MLDLVCQPHKGDRFSAEDNLEGPANARSSCVPSLGKFKFVLHLLVCGGVSDNKNTHSIRGTDVPPRISKTAWRMLHEFVIVTTEHFNSGRCAQLVKE